MLQLIGPHDNLEKCQRYVYCLCSVCAQKECTDGRGEQQHIRSFPCKIE